MVVPDPVLHLVVLGPAPVVQRVGVDFDARYVVAAGHGLDFLVLDGLDGLRVGDGDRDPEVDAVEEGVRAGEADLVLLDVLGGDVLLRVTEGQGLRVQGVYGFGVPISVSGRSTRSMVFPSSPR